MYLVVPFLWIRIRIKKISWVDKKTNEEILNYGKRRQKDTLSCRKHKWKNHVLKHDGLLIYECCTEGKDVEEKSKRKKNTVNRRLIKKHIHRFDISSSRRERLQRPS